MEIKITKTEYKELLLLLDKASNYVNDRAEKARDFDFSRRLLRIRLMLEKRNGKA